jgi:hypothetical protein
VEEKIPEDGIWELTLIGVDDEMPEHYPSCLSKLWEARNKLLNALGDYRIQRSMVRAALDGANDGAAGEDRLKRLCDECTGEEARMWRRVAAMAAELVKKGTEEQAQVSRLLRQELPEIETWHLCSGWGV